MSTPDNYQEKLTYDKNGNIQTLIRYGDLDTDGFETENIIDELSYQYDQNNKNLLINVFDSSANPQGFVDDTDGTNINDETTTDPDYHYDLNGNMISDTNKGITNIIYNHLNLPVKIEFYNSEETTINYLYNAAGQKLKKTVTQRDVKYTDYLNGFQYVNSVLQFFPHAEGYVKYTYQARRGSGTYSYFFNYSDHLGNVRLTYGMDSNDGIIKITEENHYYPFGLKHTNYNSDELIVEYNGEDALQFMQIPQNTLSNFKYKYKYNGKEYQDELGLNMYDYGARNYDPALGRWMNIDPLAEQYRRWSPYNYVMNSPMRFVDPDGMRVSYGDFIDNAGREDWVKNNETGVYSWDANATSQSTTQEGHTYVGKSIADVNTDYEASNPIMSMFTSPTFGDTSKWPGEISQHNPGFWENQSKGNFAQKALYDTTNGFYTTGQLFMFRSVGSGTMRNLDGSGTTTSQGVLGFGSTGLFFTGFAQTLTSTSGTVGKSLFLSENFGITSEKFGSSLVKAQGSWNTPGGLFKAGWSNVSKNGGGMQFRVGFGSKASNANQAVFHMYVPKTFVPNSFSNPSMQVKLSLYKLGL